MRGENAVTCVVGCRSREMLHLETSGFRSFERPEGSPAIDENGRDQRNTPTRLYWRLHPMQSLPRRVLVGKRTLAGRPAKRLMVGPQIFLAIMISGPKPSRKRSASYLAARRKQLSPTHPPLGRRCEIFAPTHGGRVSQSSFDLSFIALTCHDMRGCEISWRQAPTETSRRFPNGF